MRKHTADPCAAAAVERLKKQLTLVEQRPIFAAFGL
jgi:hypothetical protein